MVKLPRIKQDPFIGNSTFIGIFIFTDNLFDADVVFFGKFIVCVIGVYRVNAIGAVQSLSLTAQVVAQWLWGRATYPLFYLKQWSLMVLDHRLKKCQSFPNHADDSWFFDYLGFYLQGFWQSCQKLGQNLNHQTAQN
jgi:hypothetical protein